MRAAVRFAKQNFSEGYKKGSLNQFINFCNISRASLEELSEDILDCSEDGLICEKDFNDLHDLSKRTMYLLDKYVNSLYIMKKDNKWKDKKDKSNSF